MSASPADMIKALLTTPAPTPRVDEVGVVEQLGAGIAVVSGLNRALANEMLQFPNGVRGLVLDLDPDRLGVALLGNAEDIALGAAVRRTGTVASIPVGEPLLGRVIDALGNPLDGGAPIKAEHKPMEASSPAILHRSPVTRPLATGITAVDATVPVGLGQRELIIGDRQTGKTSLAIDTMLNQRQTDVLCVYCAVGQRGDAVARVIKALREGDMLTRSVVMTVGDEQAPGLAYLAPYAAMRIAESFSAKGRDVLIVFDDLTHHARAYRELSLLLRRPPGREAFPGDIFYIHARLLERAGQFSEAIGGGSITALPVLETEAENLSAYIPTNLISITDGQIYLSPRLVRKNQFPAVDSGVSVSRVGSKAQSRAFRAIAGNLRVTISQFEELEDFARFGTRLDDDTRQRLKRGSAVRAALRQPERLPQTTLAQLTILTGALEGVFDDLDEAQIAGLITAVQGFLDAADSKPLQNKLDQGEALNDEDREQLLSLARKLVSRHAKPATGPLTSKGTT